MNSYIRGETLPWQEAFLAGCNAMMIPVVDNSERQWLAEGHLAVYFIDVSIYSQETTRFWPVLSMEEQARAKRFRFSSDKNRYVVKQAALRVMLSGYIGCRPSEVDIRKSGDGKPYLARQASGGMQFSVTSSSEIVVLAMGYDSQLGVDVEKIRCIPDLLEIVERHFTNREKQKIYSCREEERSPLFYKFWTRKEAVLKAQGKGLLIPLDSVDVTFIDENCSSSKVVHIPEVNVADTYFVTDISGPVGYAVALAAEGSARRVSAKQLDAQFLSRFYS